MEAAIGATTKGETEMNAQTAKPMIGEIVTIRTDEMILWPYGNLVEVEYKGKVVGYETIKYFWGECVTRPVYEVCEDMPMYGYKAGDIFNG
jgi:hypothetical protein